MNRFILPLLILLWSLLYTGWWNCNRKPLCSGEPIAVDTVPIAATPPVIDTVQVVDTVKVVTPEEQILFTPLDVYFEVNKSGIKKTAEVETFITTAKKYFEKYPDKQLLITGHTDSDGSDELNQRLSVNRANQTKSFLMKEGFKASQLITEGKGEKEPLESNDTPEGKAKNRRSTIRLKD
jgi:outer membrane protein OmpA-like peptidoglycan-associated protein